MKKYTFFILVLSFMTGFLNMSFAKTVKVKSYFKSNGTYVSSHYKTSSNKTKLDNYSTKGNYNPYTGKSGTVNPYR